ncbi:MAG: metallophosphoesterase [Bdellovibrionales bacterium]|nr:metallophosphoesterase [Bdellovibrionales bacterium]NQZ17851.1 metallophosphoesterase [Bdellovibrionales bacterium]
MRVILLLILLFSVVQCAQADGENLPEAIDKISNEPEINDSNEKENSKAIRFAVISDLNQSYGSTSYTSHARKAVEYILDPNNKIDFVLSTGDMVAGQKSGLNYKAMWEAFHNTVTRPLKSKGIPVYPSPGNHDASIYFSNERRHYKDSWEGENVLPLYQPLKMVEGVEQNYPFSYAFTVGESLFVAMDITAIKPLTDKEMDWLEDIFEKNKDKEFKFIYGHIPFLPFAFRRERDFLSRGSVGFQKQMEQLLEDYKVTAFLSGHHHVYYPGERLGMTQFISVPLLGGGPRYLLHEDGPQSRSPHGFLVFEYRPELIEDEDMPDALRVPRNNISKYCSNCKNFNNEHFLDPSERIIFRRREITPELPQ